MDIDDKLLHMKHEMKYQHEITKASFRARSKLFEQLYIEKQRLQLSLGKCDDKDLQKLYDEVKELRNEFADNIKVENTDADYLFVTVNPKPDITFEELQKAVKKLITKKWLTRYIYVYEQRGKTPDEAGIGFHFHMLLDKQGKPEYDCKREIANTFQHVCNIELGRSNRWTKTGPFMCEKTFNKNYKNRLTYMISQKETIDKETGEYNYKDIKQTMDKLFRSKLQLEDYYKSGLWELDELN